MFHDKTARTGELSEFFASASKMNRLVVDVDVGADDALGILLLLFAEITGMVKLEAITLAAGNADIDQVTTNLMRVLEAAGRKDVSIE